MSFRSPTPDGLAIAASPNGAGDANNPPATAQELQSHRFWGRYQLTTQLPNVGTIGGAPVAGANAASSPAYDKMAPGDVAFVEADDCLYLLTDRGTNGGSDANWVCLTPSDVVQTIRDAHVLVVAQEDFLPDPGGEGIPGIPSGFANLPTSGPTGGAGITADFIDAGDGVELARALDLANALTSSAGEVDVRLRPCNITPVPDGPSGILAAGLTFPYIVGSATGGGCTLQGLSDADQKAFSCNVNAHDGSGVTTAQLTFRVIGHGMIKNITVTDPGAAVGAEAPAVGAFPCLVRMEASGISVTSGPAIRNCRISALVNANTPTTSGAACAIRVGDPSPATTVPKGAVVEDTQVITTGSLNTRDAGASNFSAVLIGNTVAANEGFFAKSQRIAVRRCNLTADVGVAILDTYGTIVEDVNIVGQGTVSSIGVVINNSLDPTALTRSEMCRIKNLEYSSDTVQASPVANGNNDAIAVLVGPASGAPEMGCLHIDGVRASWNLVDQSAAINATARRIFAMRIAEPATVRDVILDNMTACDCGTAAQGSVNINNPLAIVSGQGFTIDDGVGNVVNFVFNDVQAGPTPTNTTTTRYIEYDSNAAPTPAQIATATQIAVNGGSLTGGGGGTNVVATPNFDFAMRAPTLSGGGETIDLVSKIKGVASNVAIVPVGAGAGLTILGMGTAAGGAADGLSCFDDGIDISVGNGAAALGYVLENVRISNLQAQNAQSYGIELNAGGDADFGEISNVGINNCGLSGAGAAGVRVGDPPTVGTGRLGTKPNVEDCIVVGCHLSNSVAALEDNGVGTEAAHNIL